MAQGEACGEVDLGDGWTDIDNGEQEKKGEDEQMDLDDMMKVQVVEEKQEVGAEEDEDMEPIDIDAENEAAD